MNSKINFVSIIALAALLFSSCSSTEDQQSGISGQPMETDFVQMDKSNSTTTSSYPGIIEGSANVDIKAQVTGYLETIYVKEGEYVQKGQALFKVKSEVFNEQVNNSSAALTAALAAQANAELEVEKIKPLVDGLVVSDMQLKTAQANLQAAKAQVAQARAALGSSKINADFALIKAPVSGFIGRIPNRIGNLVGPNDATPLTSLSDISTVFVYFSMSEADFISYRKGKDNTASTQKIELVMADGTLFTENGSVESASGNIDRQTGSISMKAIFPNPSKLLRAGGAARINIYQALSNVITVPMASVKDIQDKFFVFKLSDSNKVIMTPIEIAGNTGNSYLLKSGLSTGDKIAINRIDALNEGMVVKPKVVSTDSLAN